MHRDQVMLEFAKVGHKVGSNRTCHCPWNNDQKNGGSNMGKVTIDIDQQTHLKLKLICTTKDVKIKDYVEELLTKQIVEDYKQLEIPTQ